MTSTSSRVRWLGLVSLCAVVLTVVAVGSSAAGDTLRVSVADGTNAQGADSSVDASISGNGNLVVFKSNASNLVPSDTNGTVADVFVRDRAAGTTRLVSVDPSGNQFTSASEEPAVSFDGSTVTWSTNGEIYVRALPSGPTKLVSKTPGNAPADGVSHEPALSGDGNLVAYWSTANGLGTPDPAFTSDVFVYNRATDTTELDSVGTGGTPAGLGDGSFLPSLSGDGRYIVFETKAPFDAASDPNGVYDVYLRDRLLNTTRLVSHTSSGAAGNARSFEGNGGPVISQDGSTVAFVSDASDLVSGDTNNRSDVFVFHASTGSVERASVSTAGVEGVGASTRPAINADGSVVAFQSESQLHAWDTNTDADVYVRHLAALPKRTTLESLSYNGQSVSGNKFNPVLNGDGKLVAFHSSSSGLVAGDTNGRDDVFIHELGVADATPPLVTGTAASAPNSDGWYDDNVTVHWTAIDPEPSSGQPANPPDTVASTEGKDQLFTSAPACDGNANCATGTIKLSIDKTPPAVTPTLNSANVYGWNSTDVVVGFTCSDLLSGIASCPSAVHFTSEGDNQAISAAGRTATDRAGNTSVATVRPVRIDLTAPTITYSGPVSYDVDSTVAITCAASDSLSGIATSTCTNVSGPAYLFNFGQNIVTSTVTDKAGNTATQSYTFTVAPTLGGLELFTCSLIGTGEGIGHGHDQAHDGGDARKVEQLCKKLTDDLEDAQTAAAQGNTRKRDENIRKFLKDASNQVGKLITAEQMVVLTRIAQSITG